MSWRRAAGALTLLAAVVACSSGGDGGARIPAAQFAAETCDDLGPWGAALDQAFASTTFDAAKQANDTLRRRVEERPAPAVDGGDDVKRSLLDAIDTLGDALSNGDDSEIAGALEVLDPTGGNDELRAAFSAAAACDSVASNFG